MNLSILEEPELEFGGGSRHVDIRFGIKDYGPFDLQAPKAPKEVRIGLIGTAETVEGASRWLETCAQGVAQKETKQPNLFPAFPPVTSTSSFCCEFATDASRTRVLSSAAIETVAEKEGVAARVEHAAELFAKEIEFLAENGNPKRHHVCAAIGGIGVARGGAEKSGKERSPSSIKSTHDGVSYSHTAHLAKHLRSLEGEEAKTRWHAAPPSR